MQELSPKARAYDAFSPPSLLLKDISYKLAYNDYRKNDFSFYFRFGLFEPVLNQFSMSSYYLPLVFATIPNKENQRISNVHPYIGYPIYKKITPMQVVFLIRVVCIMTAVTMPAHNSIPILFMVGRGYCILKFPSCFYRT